MNFPAKIFPRRIPALTAAVVACSLLLVGNGPAQAWPGDQEKIVPLDFLTGGGYILRNTGDKANFGIGGGVKNGDWWGHLNYIDHGLGLHVKDTRITAYYRVGTDSVDTNGQPLGMRDICGTASTNLYGDVDFHVRVTDNGEPGRDDIFIIALGHSGTRVYSTEDDNDHTLGGGGSGGGNIQLHKGNASNTPPAALPYCDI